jgi:ATP-dependent Clp protease ATP-binding subunit ClpA
MMFEQFTGDARQVIVRAQVAAYDLRHRFIAPEHLLLGLASGESGDPAAVTLRTHGMTAARVREEFTRLIGIGGLGADDAEALQTIGIDLDAVRASIEETFGPGALDQRPRRDPDLRGIKALLRRRNPEEKVGGHLPLTPRAKKVLELSLREALELGHHYIGSAHLLLGLLRTEENVAIRILSRADVDLAALRRDALASFSQAA